MPAKEVADETRCALAMIENQDGNVGRVLAKLDELELEENTIVIYFSDNGPNIDALERRHEGQKGSTDEGGVRSVCYIRWPAKLPAGHTVTQIGGAIDLLPTLTALAGVTRVGDKPLDGRDLTPLLMKQNDRLAGAHDLLHLGRQRQRAHADAPPRQRRASSSTWSPIPARRRRSTTSNRNSPRDSPPRSKAWRQDVFGAS